MLIAKIKIDDILKNKNISYYKLSKLINYDEGSLSKIFKGKNTFPEKLTEKILPVLEVSREELESWIIADKYTKELLGLAIQVKKDFPYKKKSVLTVKIDEILQNKDMSRTKLAKQINHSQTGLNAAITGEIGISKSLLEKLSVALEIPQDEIKSWILADKHSLRVLEMTYKLFEDSFE